MLKRTDSATVTKASVTVSWFISLSCNFPKISCTELHGGSVVSETQTPFLMPHLMV